VYFLLNSVLVAIVLAFEKRANVLTLWWQNFPWISLSYFGGVSVAALLVSYTHSVDLSTIGIILPLLLISYLTYRTSHDRIEDSKRHVDQVNELYMSTIESLAMAVDAKDQLTHGHIRRVQVFAVELAKRLGVEDEQSLKAIETAALLHDMGKLAIPEHILNKPGKLTQAEFEKMKRHADIGADLLSSIKFPYPVVPIVRHHHEHWDGTGYPSGISGTDIPLGARILSVVDCFDALNSDRPYRPRLSLEDTFEILHERRGTAYDPLVVDTFIRSYLEIAPAAIRAGENAPSIIPTPALEEGVDVASRPFEHIRANASESALLIQSSQDILKALSLSHALELAAQCLRQLTPATVYALFMYESKTDVLVCNSAFGDTQGLLQGLTIRVGERITGWCAANRRPSLNSDASLDLAKIAHNFTPPLSSTLSIPLEHERQALGVLTAYAGRREAFVEADLYVFEQVAASLTDKLLLLQPKAKSTKIISFRNDRV
jgi:putative nucleotidyltransferase with HDIG domain